MPDAEIVENYRDNPVYRNLFFKCVKIVFPSADFKSWYKNGYWTTAYIPFSIVKQGNLVSNVSISLMNSLIRGIGL